MAHKKDQLFPVWGLTFSRNYTILIIDDRKGNQNEKENDRKSVKNTKNKRREEVRFKGFVDKITKRE